MIYRINTKQACKQQPEEGRQEPGKTEVQANQEPLSAPFHGNQKDKQPNCSKESHQYICTAPHLIEALEWMASYFQNLGATDRTMDVAPEKGPPVREPGNGIKDGFQEQWNRTLEPEREFETQPPSKKPILRNKTAVQAEEIWRTVDIHTVLTQADENEYDRKLKSLTAWNEYNIMTEEDDSPQNTRTDTGNRNRKGVAIHEEENTVRGIPKDNNGTRQAKRYSEEPSWLDQYMENEADEEFQEEFYGALNEELDTINPAQSAEPLTVRGGSDREFDEIQRIVREMKEMERNYRPFQGNVIKVQG